MQQQPRRRLVAPNYWRRIGGGIAMETLDGEMLERARFDSHIGTTVLEGYFAPPGHEVCARCGEDATTIARLIGVLDFCHYSCDASECALHLWLERRPPSREWVAQNPQALRRVRLSAARMVDRALEHEQSAAANRGRAAEMLAALGDLERPPAGRLTKPARGAAAGAGR